jgi:hypothetical protein
MDEKMMYGKEIPEYYPTMHLDGFTPEEIMYATKKKMLREASERDLVDEI